MREKCPVSSWYSGSGRSSPEGSLGLQLTGPGTLGWPVRGLLGTSENSDGEAGKGESWAIP